MRKISGLLKSIVDASRRWSVKEGNKSPKVIEENVAHPSARDGHSAPIQPSEKAQTLFVPEAPKKPQGPFLVFAAKARKIILQENPGLSMIEVARRTGIEWRALDKQQREVYNQEAKLEFEKYIKEKEEFHSSLAPEQFEEHTRLKVEDKLNKSKRRLAALERQLEKPKQPGSAFTFFLRENIKEVDPEKQTFQAIGKRWKNLSESEKQVYIGKAEEAMTKYKQDMELYKQRVAQSEEHSKKLVALTSSISDLKKQLRNLKSP